jgi:hypothetical protein
VSELLAGVRTHPLLGRILSFRPLAPALAVVLVLATATATAEAPGVAEHRAARQRAPGPRR